MTPLSARLISIFKVAVLGGCIFNLNKWMVPKRLKVPTETHRLCSILFETPFIITNYTILTTDKFYGPRIHNKHPFAVALWSFEVSTVLTPWAQPG